MIGILKILNNDGPSYFCMNQELSNSVSLISGPSAINSNNTLNHKLTVAHPGYNDGLSFHQWSSKRMGDTMMLNTRGV